MRRTSLLIVLLSWISAVSAGSEAARIHAVPAGDLPSAGAALAAHDIGPAASPAVEATFSNAAPQSTVRTGGGPIPVAPSAFGTGTRHGPIHFARASASRASELRRLNRALDLTRARSGFLTTASSTAPPRSHG